MDLCFRWNDGTSALGVVRWMAFIIDALLCRALTTLQSTVSYRSPPAATPFPTPLLHPLACVMCVFV